MKIDTICNSLLETLIQAGYNENTIFNYRGVIRRFKAFCKEKEAFEYTPELGQSYADDVISKKTGKFSKCLNILRWRSHQISWNRAMESVIESQSSDGGSHDLCRGSQ